jgi:hypothetical protein
MASYAEAVRDEFDHKVELSVLESEFGWVWYCLSHCWFENLESNKS